MTTTPVGQFIVIEGIDGAGTTTQLQLVASLLRERGFAVLTTREPSDGPVGRFIRQQLVSAPGAERPVDELALAALFAADRLNHLHREVLPAISRGDFVLCDRYLWSSFAYQTESVGDDAWVRALNAKALQPSLTVLVDVSAELASTRRAQRGGEAERYEDDAFQARLVTRYRALCAADPTGFLVDGAQSKNAIAAQIVARILPD